MVVFQGLGLWEGEGEELFADGKVFSNPTFLNISCFLFLPLSFFKVIKTWLSMDFDNCLIMVCFIFVDGRNSILKIFQYEVQ